MTREELVAQLAEVSHRTWIRQAVRDKGTPRDTLSDEVHPHDLERAEDTVAELERLGVLSRSRPSPNRRDRLLRTIFGPGRKEREARREARNPGGEGRTRENAERLQRLKDEDATQVYEQVCTNIRTTDDISFKLLGLVPLISGSGIVVLLTTSTGFSQLPLVVFVGIFGAIVTFGLHRWELRNVETCDSLIEFCRELEQDRLGLTKGQFLERATAPKLWGRAIGKTEAEHLIYWTAIWAWLLLPIVAASLAAFDTW